MKKLTFDRAFDLCMEQWEWCIEQIKAGDERCIAELKKAWMRRHRFKGGVYENCFFCEYARQHDGQLDGCSYKGFHGARDCSQCPGSLVSSQFHCERHNSYHWDKTPLKFHAKLLELDRKRKKAAKK